MRCSGGGLRKLHVATLDRRDPCCGFGCLGRHRFTRFNNNNNNNNKTESMQLLLNFRQIVNVTRDILTLRNVYLKGKCG